MSNLQDALAKMAQEGALIVAPGGPDVVLCPKCGRSVVFHAEDCPVEAELRQLAQQIANTCFVRGVVPDYDFLRFDMAGRAQFAPIKRVFCPEHGMAPWCGDVENGHCSRCSNEFHEELV